MRYKAREIKFLDLSKRVVLCNTRASSALTSISNCLLLTNGFRIGSNEVEVSYLEQCISRFALDTFMNSVPSTDENKRKLQSYFGITKKLSTGIDVNPMAGEAGFEVSNEYEFFVTLGIPLLHASTLNEQVLPTLQGQLEEGQVGILYLNREFNTICKHNGTVYILQEDEGIHMNNPSAVWKTFVNRKEIFVASDFLYITARIDKKLHKCSRCLKEFCTIINYQRHVEAHLVANLSDSLNEDTLAKYWDEISDEGAHKIISSGNETVEKSLGSPVESIMMKWITSPQFRATPAEVRVAARNIKDLNASGSKKASSNVLLSILNVGSEGTFMSTNVLKEKVPFVEADRSENTMRSMLACFSLKVEELLIKKWCAEKTDEANAAMSQLLMDDEKQSQEKSDQQPVDQDVDVAPETSTSYPQSDDEIHEVSDNKEAPKDENRKLVPSDLAHMPELVNEEYFPIFVARKTLVRTYTHFNQVKVSALTRVGRKIAKGFLKYILKVHKSGNCWNGDWDILDIRVQMDGAALVINKTPISSTKDGIVMDLQKFIVLLDLYYKIEGIKGPLYFDEFQSDVMAVPELGSKEFELFQRFLADHLAFLPPLARSTLIESLFKVCDDIRSEARDYGYKPLHSKICPGWTQIKSSLVYKGVFFYNATITVPYGDNYWDLLRFLRNFSNHALRYTKINGVQVIEDITVLDIMMGYDLGLFITKLLFHLLNVFEKPERIVSIWIAYKTSDDATEENDEDNVEN